MALKSQPLLSAERRKSLAQDRASYDELQKNRQIQELRCLVLTDGYRYAKGIAQVIVSEYSTKPPKTAEETQKWETYCTMKWAFDRFFTELELLAKTPEAAGAEKRSLTNVT